MGSEVAVSIAENRAHVLKIGKVRVVVVGLVGYLTEVLKIFSARAGGKNLYTSTNNKNEHHLQNRQHRSRQRTLLTVGLTVLSLKILDTELNATE